MKVAVIGGGPCGLATLKFLATVHEFFPIPPIEARLFEGSSDVGGTFVQRVYEDAELVSSKYLTAFSDFRIPADLPDFITPADYVCYLKAYIAHFNLTDLIECFAKIENVRRDKGGKGHILKVGKPGGVVFEYDCDAVAICTGLNVFPRLPHIPGIDKVPTVIHSSQFKKRAQFGQDQNVVVLGGGETGMDMAHLAITSPTKSVTLCHRDGFFCAPKIIPIPLRPGEKLPSRPNKPVDTSVVSLFDTAYAHPIIQKSPLLWFLYDRWVKKMHWLISGTEEGPDQWVGHMSKGRKHLDSIFLCKSDRALPYMSAGHRSQSWWNRFRSSMLNVPLRDNNGKNIEVVRWPKLVDETGVMHFEDSDPRDSLLKHVKPDVVVMATGYSTNFSFLDNDYPTLSHANVRGIYKDDDVSVGFVGFVRPSIGAIPPLGELQAQLWVLRLLQHFFPQKIPIGPGKDALTSYEMDYKLHPRAGYDMFTDKRGVDHESYAYQLALDMGAAPTITHVMSRGWKIFFTWAMGSNFNTKFRLVGPWKWEAGAEEIMRGELYNVVKRSGGFVFLMTYSILPFILLGAMSVILYAASWLYGLVAKVGRFFTKGCSKHRESQIHLE